MRPQLSESLPESPPYDLLRNCLNAADQLLQKAVKANPDDYIYRASRLADLWVTYKININVAGSIGRYSIGYSEIARGSRFITEGR
jgi:hypothetical protein